MENLNSVCYVAEVIEIKPIEGADKIELVIVNGWSCLTRKGVQNIGDLVVVMTTDAVIPTEISEDYGIKNYLRNGNRVRTIKLKGVYSDCLLLPTDYIPNEYRINGKDCMDILNVHKYEPPAVIVNIPKGRKIKYKLNENFKVYYKFPNIKNIPSIFSNDDFVQITRKIHGTNARYGIVKKTKFNFLYKVKRFFRLNKKWDDYEYVYGSHIVEKKLFKSGFYGINVWRKIANKYNIKKKLWKFVKTNDNIGDGFIIYGEIYGPEIQENYDYGLSEIKFVGFDILLNNNYLETLQTYLIFNEIDLPHVEILYSGYWNKEIQDKFTFNNYIENTKIPHEGIVIKEKSGNRNKVAKVINPDYLIYSEKNNVGDSH
jgi:RNA ligase (TIGR02306 family)